MYGWFRVFFSIWLIFFSISQASANNLPLVVLAAIVFVVAIMEVIKKK
jgi:hypothetical protein